MQVVRTWANADAVKSQVVAEFVSAEQVSRMQETARPGEAFTVRDWNFPVGMVISEAA